MAALAESFGRGAMTNHWIDVKNSDCILIMGANPAENHPVSFRWINEARKKGALVISVDPRFTRTSSQADYFSQLRSGTDIAFLGGMIKYILENKKYFRQYVAEYTNAGFILKDSFDFKDGLFSGFDPQTRTYDKTLWAFESDENGNPKTDKSLRHPRCVFLALRKHFRRYDPDTVSSITGTPRKQLEQIYQAYASTGARDKAGTVMYAMGWTQHTVGVQNIRAMAIIQLLLGNMGVAGGGVNALRGESNVQGSTDHGILYHIWPGYLKTPKASQTSLDAYNKACTSINKDSLSANWWSNYPKYSVSLLKSFFGKNATADNEFGYHWLPKIDDDQTCSWMDLFDQMYKGTFSGFFAWGQNPASSGANANKTRQALASLDWMVNVNMFENETGSFWQGPGMDPEKIKTRAMWSIRSACPGISDGYIPKTAMILPIC